MAYKTTITPSHDTGLGLVFRLNDIWREIENCVGMGDYNKWNFKLDRIWVNLCYRNEMDIVIDSKTKEIIDIKLGKDDVEQKDFLDRGVEKARKEMYDAKKNGGEGYSKNKDYVKAKNKLYDALNIKDIWTRKKMHENKLYIKELELNPAGSMWNK